MLIKYFSAGLTARSVAEFTGLNRNTAILFFHKLRETIHEEIVGDQPSIMSGEIEVDESYFDGRREGIRRRDAAGKVPVFEPTLSTMPIHSGHMMCSKNIWPCLNYTSNTLNKLSLRLESFPTKNSL